MPQIFPQNPQAGASPLAAGVRQAQAPGPAQMGNEAMSSAPPEASLPAMALAPPTTAVWELALSAAWPPLPPPLPGP